MSMFLDPRMMGQARPGAAAFPTFGAPRGFATPIGGFSAGGASPGFPQASPGFRFDPTMNQRGGGHAPPDLANFPLQASPGFQSPRGGNPAVSPGFQAPRSMGRFGMGPGQASPFPQFGGFQPNPILQLLLGGGGFGGGGFGGGGFGGGGFGGFGGGMGNFGRPNPLMLLMSLLRGGF